MRTLAAPILLGFAALLASACGDGGAGQPASPGPTATIPAAPAEAPTAGPSPPPASTPVPPPEGTQTSQQAADAAFAAALTLFDGVGEADCETNNPQNKNCISPQSDQFTVQRGIAVFGVSAPEGPGGYAGVLGREPAGEWNVWLRTQNAYQLLMLPGGMLVCAEGQVLNVRSEPAIDAPVVGSLEDLTSVRAEQFVLTESAGDENNGYGWYHLSAPLDGWAYSKYLANAEYGDCRLRDGQEAAGP